MTHHSLATDQQHNARSRWRNIIIGLVVAMLIIAGLVAIKMSQFGAMGASGANFTMPPEPINTYVVRAENWQSRASSVGTVKAVQGTVVSTEADGIVRKIFFTAGANVKAGDKLVQLDVDIEKAQLRSAEAAEEGARLSFNRANELRPSNAISQSDFTNIEVALKQAQAQVDNIRAQIDKKLVRAPFSGKLGIRNISVGQFLNKGSPIVSLYSLSPVYVEFSMPQQRLADLSEGLAVHVTSDSYPGAVFEGKITSINPNIDLTTRNVQVQATFANADGKLRPGMFVLVDMALAKTEELLMIPATAIIHSPTGDSVFVVEKGSADKPGQSGAVIKQQLVTLGGQHGDFVVATKGLSAGQEIVSAGVFKLRSGMSVVVDNTLAPEFKLAPEPDNT